MKKAIFLGLFMGLLLPLSTFAAFDTSLKYGAKGSAVIEMQEFLTDEGVYTGPITGNFYALTLKGVKAFQAKYNITSSGFWGPLTRAKANTLVDLSASEADEQTVGVVVPAKSDFEKLMELIAQIKSSQDSQLQTAQQIVVNTTPTASPIPVPPPGATPVDVCPNISGVQDLIPNGMVFSDSIPAQCVFHTTSVNIQKSAQSPLSPMLLSNLSYNPFYILRFDVSSTPVVFTDEIEWSIESNDFNLSDVQYVKDSSFGKFILTNPHTGSLKIKISSLVAHDAGGNVVVSNLPFISEDIVIQ